MAHCVIRSVRHKHLCRALASSRVLLGSSSSSKYRFVVDLHEDWQSNFNREKEKGCHLIRIAFGKDRRPIGADLIRDY